MKMGESNDSCVIDEQVEKKQMLIHMRTIIESLEERDKSIVEFRLYGQMSYKEIAHLVGIREATAKVIFSRAKVKIQEQLKARYGYEI